MKQVKEKNISARRASNAKRAPVRGNPSATAARNARAEIGKLTPDHLVQVAVRLAESKGLEALSMRTLAAEVGVEAMSLYSHLPSKQELLGRMASLVVNSVPTPRAALAPRERLCQLARSIRAAGREFPNVFPLVVLMPLEIHSAARFTEIALQAFLDAGLSDHQAICSMRVYLSYVRGSVLWEIGGFVAGYRASPMQRISPRVLADIDSLEENLFSQTRRLARTLISIDPERAFREGYDHILDTLMPKQRRRS